MIKSKGACDECELNCQLLHGYKKGLEPVVSRFIKIMIGTDYSEALFLPPKFVKYVEDLVGQEMKLEDSNGVSWTVALSYYKGKLAFHRGWDMFSDDKSLKIGDILVFNYIKDGPFVVQAFGRDACEKLNNPRRHLSVKRARISEEKVNENTRCHRTHKDVRKAENRKQLCAENELYTMVDRDSGYVQCEKNVTENTRCNRTHKDAREAENSEQLCADDELYMMVDRDSGYVQCDNRTWLHDLSNFEMQQNIQPVSVNKEHMDGQKFNSIAAQFSVKFQSDWDLNDNGTNETMALSMQTAITPVTTIIRGNNNSEPTCNMSVEHEDHQLVDLKNDHPLAAPVSDDILKVVALPQSPQMNGGDSSHCPRNSRRNFRKENEMVKKVKIEIGEEVYGGGQMRASLPSTKQEDGNTSTASEICKTVQTVPINTSVVPSTFVNCVTYLARTNGSKIDSTESWPKITFPLNGEGMITITLEDPEGREWAGVHCENCGFRALLASWDKIKVKNNIQPGDHLVFSLADVEKVNKYKFCVVRNS